MIHDPCRSLPQAEWLVYSLALPGGRLHPVTVGFVTFETSDPIEQLGCFNPGRHFVEIDNKRAEVIQT